MSLRIAILALAVSAAGPAFAEEPVYTEDMIADCTVLAGAADPDALGGPEREAAERCRLLLEGFHGAAMLLTPEFYPLTAQLGYCMPPDASPRDLAAALVRHLDADPDCARLAHFSMCLNAAFAAEYAGTC